MKWLILFLSFLMVSCGGLDGKSLRYLRQSQTFQVNLQMYQRKLKEVAAVTPDQREKAARALLTEVETAHKALGDLEPSTRVMPVHKQLDALYTTMESFIEVTLAGTGDSQDPKIVKLSKEWAEHLESLNKELQNLEH